MAIDAVVYCDCVEKGLLLSRPPHPDLLYVSEDGCLDARSDDPRIESKFCDWLFGGNVCRHGALTLIERCLGGSGTMVCVRRALKYLSPNDAEDFPTLTKVHASCTTDGFLSVEEVQRLRGEIQDIRARDWSGIHTDDSAALKGFLRQLEELSEASRSVNKPIAW